MGLITKPLVNVPNTTATVNSISINRQDKDFTVKHLLLVQSIVHEVLVGLLRVTKTMIFYPASVFRQFLQQIKLN